MKTYFETESTDKKWQDHILGMNTYGNLYTGFVNDDNDTMSENLYYMLEEEKPRKEIWELVWDLVGTIGPDKIKEYADDPELVRVLTERGLL